MELNFSSVEMSCEPRAEASSLDYAEVKLTFNSVETIPHLNASAAFQVNSGKVFKEDTDIVPVIVDDTLSYVPWGGNNAMPYDILRLIEDDETLSTCQMFNAEVCYGSGLGYGTDECSAAVKQQVEDFLLDNALPSYFLGVCPASRSPTTAARTNVSCTRSPKPCKSRITTFCSPSTR